VSFAYPSTIKFSQVDAAGIVFFSRLFELCHEAYEAALAQAGWPIAEVTKRDWVLPIVRAEADYALPIRLGDAVTVEVRLVRVGRSSVTIGFRVISAAGCCATIRHVHAAVDRATFAPCPVPGEFVGALSEILSDPP
jgi:YbgC/YbaW family acyl-CoA thioester hydrolase